MTNEELIKECERRGLTVTAPKKETRTFTVTARYDRGLGPEYITLKNIEAKTCAEAQELANEQANHYFLTEPGHKKTIVNEVRIRPNE